MAFLHRALFARRLIAARWILPLLVAAIAIASAPQSLYAQDDPGAAPAEDAASPGGDATTTPQYVIPPGEETVLGGILGTGQELVGGCKMASGQIAASVLHATYTCPGGELIVDLRHPDAAPAGALRTQRFAVTIVSGTPPPAFMDELIARIRAHEGEFEWKGVGGPSPMRPRVGRPIVIGLVLVAILVWVLRRVRRRAPAES